MLLCLHNLQELHAVYRLHYKNNEETVVGTKNTEINVLLNSIVSVLEISATYFCVNGNR
jgi:hypothetical protein